MVRNNHPTLVVEAAAVTPTFVEHSVIHTFSANFKIVAEQALLAAKIMHQGDTAARVPGWRPLVS